MIKPIPSTYLQAAKVAIETDESCELSDSIDMVTVRGAGLTVKLPTTPQVGRPYRIIATAGLVLVDGNGLPVVGAGGSVADGTFLDLVSTGTEWVSAGTGAAFDFPLSNALPLDVTNLPASAGIVNEASRADHKHDVVFAAPRPLFIGNTTDAGTSPALALSDHGHAFPAPVIVTTVSRTAGSVGASVAAAREDHNHNVLTDVPVAVGGANAIGSSVALSRADHVHSVPTSATHLFLPFTFAADADQTLDAAQSNADTVVVQPGVIAAPRTITSQKPAALTSFVILRNNNAQPIFFKWATGGAIGIANNGASAIITSDGLNPVLVLAGT